MSKENNKRIKNCNRGRSSFSRSDQNVMTFSINYSSRKEEQEYKQQVNMYACMHSGFVCLNPVLINYQAWRFISTLCRSSQCDRFDEVRRVVVMLPCPYMDFGMHRIEAGFVTSQHRFVMSILLLPQPLPLGYICIRSCNFWLHHAIRPSRTPPITRCRSQALINYKPD